jgi:hypothetical protein
MKITIISHSSQSKNLNRVLYYSFTSSARTRHTLGILLVEYDLESQSQDG